MINIADLLRNAKKGTILWSPLFGPVEFMQLGKNDQIWVKVDNSEPFDKYGRYFGSRFTEAECLLFPSKECRTWENFKLPTKPKFKVGDWIVQNDDGAVSQITKIINEKDEDGEYRAYEHTNGYFAECFDDEFHFWTIADAKDGDVLAADECYVMFKEIDGLNIKCYCTYHYIGFNPSFHIDTLQNKAAFNPATKEQRDILFAKMKESGYQWDADKKELRKIIEPKFKAGDWIANDYCAGKVIALTDDAYLLDSGQGIPFSCEHNAHLWTIQDAKDGDVLVDTLSGTRALTILFRFINADDSISAYCGWNGHTFRVTIDGLGYGTLSSTQYVPATKEQRDLLFQKMKEAGYEWDADKKKLKKIQLHYDIESFYAGMPVLVRDNKDQEWRYTTFSHISSRFRKTKFAAGCTYWCQCIPFEGNEALLGTTDMCNERFINW